MKQVIVITGQTATGKTRLALQLKERNNGELVNFDSRQIYKHLDIITGKDISNICLYDIVDPKERFSSFDYVSHAVPVLKRILNLKKTPILVGGTYLYLKHLLYGVQTEDFKPDWDLRLKLEKKSKIELQKILQEMDSEQFSRLNNSDRNNPRRLIRRIEIATQESKETINGKPETLSEKLNIPNLAIKIIGLRFESRNDLVKAIRQRVEERIKEGALSEVKNLLSLGYTKDDPGLHTIGYAQIIRFLQKEISFEEAIQEWIIKEVQYAKRQYTFMKKDKNISWEEVKTLSFE